MPSWERVLKWKLNKFYKHWMWWTKFYKVRIWIKNRCYNVKNIQYKDYWWRWIMVCNKRLNFEWFYEDIYESFIKHNDLFWWRGTSLDREDNDWNYELGNCRWATNIEQSNNKRNIHYLEYDWKKQSIAQWWKELWIWRTTIQYRISHWWSIENALFSKNNDEVKMGRYSSYS